MMIEVLPTVGDVVTISRKDLDDLRDIVRAAVREELYAVGLRADEPAHVDEAREDFRFVRRWRKAMESAASKVGMTVLVLVVGGAVSVVVLGFKTALGR
ncbi:hypothetical protein [Microvirga antarctica]|uniref:hypothetical protein n=1 Tax=Microvirga antarctica TaxID=2819233 RepID=UPI001B317C20|nr:hypothetical protein [Microvirga antarctica]